MNKLVVRETPPGTFTELHSFDTSGSPSSIRVNNSDGTVTSHLWDIIDNWNADALSVIGIYLVAPATIPAGKNATGYHFERINGVVAQVLELVDAQITSATPRQIRLALTQIGMRTPVENYVATASQDVKDSWDFATEIMRSDPMLTACTTSLGKTDADLDALFNLAATL